MNRTCLFSRLYGKTAKQIAIEHNVPIHTIRDYHRRGLLKKMQIIPDQLYGLEKNEFRLIMKTLSNINTRCNNPKDRRFKYYGGKGIKHLLSIEDIVELFKATGRSLNRPSIHRINSDGNYERNNCIFIELTENSREAGKSGRGRPKKGKYELLRQLRS